MNKPNHEKTVDMLNVNVRHEFSEAELKEQANLLSQAVKNKAAVEADKKVAMSGFTNQIKKLDADINIHSSNHNNGYTYRDEACELWLDYDTQYPCVRIQGYQHRGKARTLLPKRLPEEDRFHRHIFRNQGSDRAEQRGG